MRESALGVVGGWRRQEKRGWVFEMCVWRVAQQERRAGVGIVY